MLSCTSSNKLTKGKSQRVPNNLDNPKKGQNFEWGWTCPWPLPVRLLVIQSAEYDKRVTNISLFIYIGRWDYIQIVALAQI